MNERKSGILQLARGPRRRRARGVLWTAVVASVLTLVTGANVPTAMAGEPPSASTASAGSLPPGAGVTVGGTNTVAADVLGLGYEQVVRLNGSRVEIVEPVTRGSAVLRSFEAGTSHAWPKDVFGPVFYGGINMANRVGQGASRLAVAGEHIYVSVLRVRGGGALGQKFPDGSVTTKYSVDGVVLNQRVEGSDFAVTALAGIEWQGKEYLAIGFNYGGVRIVDHSVEGMPDVHLLMLHYSGPHRFGSVYGSNERDQITQLRFGPVGDKLMLAVGVLTGDMPALLAFDAVTGAELWAKNLRPNDPEKFEWPQEIEFGPFGAGGRTELAVGWPTLGRLSFLEAVDGGDRGQIDGGVVGAIRFFTDVSGEARVGYGHGLGNQWSSHVVKRDQAGNLVVVESAGANDLPWMVPGYRPWSVQVDNRSRAQVAFRTFAGPTRAEGCWRSAPLSAAAGPLPTQPASIPAGAAAGPFATAHLFSGDACRDNPGIFFAQVEPAGEPGHRQVVQFEADRHGVRVKEQVGTGRLVVQVEAAGLFGFRVIVTDRHAAPTIVDGPALEAVQLTPAPVGAPPSGPDDPSRPVYRFAVSPVTWQVPGASADLTSATFPLPIAQGSIDGQTWDPLGTVASPLAPTRDGDRVTLGTSTFDWQTAPGAAKDYRFFRVVAENYASDVIDVGALEAPLATAQVARPNLTGTGTPRPNGLDQAPMRLTLLNSSSQGLDSVTHADLYRRIYFRDATTNALITGLGNPAEPNQLVMASFAPGQYANEGLAAASNSIGVYLSARYTQQNRSIVGVLRTAADRVEKTAAHPLRPMTNTLLADGAAAQGLAAGSCDPQGWDQCALVDPATGPALHSLTGSTVSVQFRTVAVPGTASLPLAQRDQFAENLRLVGDTFRYEGARALLSNPNQFTEYAAITTDLIARGERVAAENHPVKAR